MDVKTLPIDEIGLSVRSQNALHRAEIHTVEQLLEQTEASLTLIRNLGRKSIEEILGKIEEYRALDAAGGLPSAEGENEQETVLRYLQQTGTSIDALDLLSARAYNVLLLAVCTELHRLAFQSEEDLLQLPRMDLALASEIVTQTARYLQQEHEAIRAWKEDQKTTVSLRDMLHMEQYREAICLYVTENDIEVITAPLSNRPKNQLCRVGLSKMSDVIFKTEQELKEIKNMGAGSVGEIIAWVEAYLAEHEQRILAVCAGDLSAMMDDSRIEKMILALYKAVGFGGLNLAEITQQLPKEVTQERLKAIVGKLLAENKLEYVDYRVYRVYGKLHDQINTCSAIDDRSRIILKKRLDDLTLDAVAQEYGLTRERVRQIEKKDMDKVRLQYEAQWGTDLFDEDYYRYFYETYAFDTAEASRWLNIPLHVWNYFAFLNLKQGAQPLTEAFSDTAGLGIGLRLKIKNWINDSRLFIDGVWVDKRRSALEEVVARKFCRDDTSFKDFPEIFNNFLQSLELLYDEDLYYTDAVYRTRKNRMADARFLLWQQNEVLRYYDIDSRDYTELLETLNFDLYENVEFSTAKFMAEYPDVMRKYDIRDQYELHNLLRKIVPEGSFHDFRCSRMPNICFGSFDRESAIMDILIANAPIDANTLAELVSKEYGHEMQTVLANYLRPFGAYYHNGIYSIDQKAMPVGHMSALKERLTNDFYYINEIKQHYAQLGGDVEEINPYNLKTMGFIVLSKYAIQNYPTLNAYFTHLLTKDDITDLMPLRRRFGYIQSFSQTLTNLKKDLEIIEFEPGKLLHFRKLAEAGITKDDLRAFGVQAAALIEDGNWFSARLLRHRGFDSDLYELGFSEHFYGNLLLAQTDLSYSIMYKTLIFYKGRQDMSCRSFICSVVRRHGSIDIYDLITELTEHYGCTIDEKWDITGKLGDSEVYYDPILERLYANSELYYRELDETEDF